MPHPLLIAHRGDHLHFPENTLEAFQSALGQGAAGIELDVHLNQAGEPIVVHNYLFDPTAPQLLLATVLEQFDKNHRLEIEIKSLEDEAVARIAHVIHHYQPPDLEVTSSVQPLLPQIAKYFPNAHRGLIFRRWLIEEWMPPDFRMYWLLHHLKWTQATVLHLDLDLYFPELITQLHAHGHLAHTHLKDASKEAFEKVIELGIDQCTCDDLEVLKWRN